MTDKIKKLSAKEAECRIKELLELGYFRKVPHVYEQMEKRNYCDLDIIKVLSKGKVKEPPIYDEKFNNWKCRVEGSATEGEKTIVLVAIQNHEELVCITIMDKLEG